MEMRNIDDVFARLGMPKHAGRIYRVLEKDGPLLATDLIRISGTHRPAAYRALAALEQSKLAIKTKSGKRRLWSAADPKRIEALFGRALRDASSLLPDTLARTEESVTASLKLFHGPEGIRAVFDDVIDHTPRGETFYRYTSERDLEKVNAYLSSDYRARRDKKKLERLVISNPVSGVKKRPRLERFIKFISPETGVFMQNVIQIIYGDRVAFIDLNQEEAMVIENAALADFQKVIFRQLYKKLPD